MKFFQILTFIKNIDITHFIQIFVHLFNNSTQCSHLLPHPFYNCFYMEQKRFSKRLNGPYFKMGLSYLLIEIGHSFYSS